MCPVEISEKLTPKEMVSMIRDRRFNDIHGLLCDDPDFASADPFLYENALVYCVKRGGMAAFDVIQFLIGDRGIMATAYYRTMTLKVSAACGHVELIEAVCLHGWHRPDDFYYILSASTDREEEAIPVLTWLKNNKNTYFDKNMKAKTLEIEIAFSDAISNELLQSAKFILDHREDLGCGEWFPDMREVVICAASNGATRSLDLLCDLWGFQFVSNHVKQNVKIGSDFYDDVKSWLASRNKKVTKKHLRHAMHELDELKEKLQENDYVTIANHMKKIWEDIVIYYHNKQTMKFVEPSDRHGVKSQLMQNKSEIKSSLQRAIEKMDTIKDSLQQDDYLVIINHLVYIYDAWC